MVPPFNNPMFWTTAVILSVWMTYSPALLPLLGRKVKAPDLPPDAENIGILPSDVTYYSRNGALLAVGLNVLIALAVYYGYIHLVSERYPSSDHPMLAITIACILWAQIALRIVAAIRQVGKRISKNPFGAVILMYWWLLVGFIALVPFALGS